MTSSMLRRQLKNLVQNYSEAEVKVREATSNDPWGPSSSQMADISDLTYNVVACNEIMTMLWKRLKDDKNWRHIHKSLTLLEYLLKTGDDRVLLKMKDNIYIVKALTEYRFVEKDGKDQGSNVREKAKVVLVLMEDDEKLKEERDFACKTREKTSKGSAASSADAVKDPNYKPCYVPGATGLPSLDNIPSVADLAASFASRKEERLKQEADKKEAVRRANMSEDELKWEDAGKGNGVKDGAWGGEAEEEVKPDAWGAPKEPKEATDPWGAPTTPDTIETAASSDAWGGAAKTDEDPFAAPKADEDPFAAPKADEDPFAPPKANEDPFAPPKANEDPFAPPKANEDPFAPPKAEEDPFAPPKANEDPFAPPKADEDPFAPPKADEDPFAPPKANEDPFAAPKNGDDPFAAPKNGDDPFAPPKGGTDPFSASNDDPFNTPKDSSDPFNAPNDKDDPFAAPKDKPDPFSSSNNDPFNSPKDDPFSTPQDDQFNSTTNDPFSTPKDDPFSTPSAPATVTKEDPFAASAKDDPFTAPTTPPKEDPFSSATQPTQDDPFASATTPPKEDPFTSPTKPIQDDLFTAPTTPPKEDPFTSPTKPTQEAALTPPPNGGPFSAPTKSDPFSATTPPKADPFAVPSTPPKDDASDPFSAPPSSLLQGSANAWEVPGTESDTWGVPAGPKETKGEDPWGNGASASSPVDNSDPFGDTSMPDSDPWGAPAPGSTDDAWGSPAPPSDSSSSDPFGDGASKASDPWGAPSNAASNGTGKRTVQEEEMCKKMASFLGSAGASLIDLDNLFSSNPRNTLTGLGARRLDVGTFKSRATTSGLVVRSGVSLPGGLFGSTVSPTFGAADPFTNPPQFQLPSRPIGGFQSGSNMLHAAPLCSGPGTVQPVSVGGGFNTMLPSGPLMGNVMTSAPLLGTGMGQSTVYGGNHHPAGGAQSGGSTLQAGGGVSGSQSSGFVNSHNNPFLF